MNMIIATHNAHKIEEFGRILAPLGITMQTAELTEAEETGTTFRENAYIKAKLTKRACRASRTIPAYRSII